MTRKQRDYMEQKYSRNTRDMAIVAEAAAKQASREALIKKHNARIRELGLHKQYSQGQGCAYVGGFPL